MATADQAVRRIRVRSAFKHNGFELVKAKEKADKFQKGTNCSLYFYWPQGKGLNLSINPNIDYLTLLKLEGVSVPKTSLKSAGLRTGTAIEDYPRTFEGIVPKNPQSRVGRMLEIQESALTSFLTAFGSLVELTAKRSDAKALPSETASALQSPLNDVPNNSSSGSVLPTSRPTLNTVPNVEADDGLYERMLLTDLDEIGTDTADKNDPTERLDSRMSRIGQGKFRKNTIATWGGKEKCAVTGIGIREVLTASHIIPWAEDVGQRKRGCNGILLAAHLDRLFDRHLIGFKVSSAGGIFSLVVAPCLADRFLNLASLGINARTTLDLSTVNPKDRSGLEKNLSAHLDIVLGNL